MLGSQFITTSTSSSSRLLEQSLAQVSARLRAGMWGFECGCQGLAQVSEEPGALVFVVLCITVNYRPLRARYGSRASGKSGLLARVRLQGMDTGHVMCGWLFWHPCG